MPASVQLDLDPSAINGLVTQYISDRAEAVASSCRASAPVGKTGSLAGSITLDVSGDGPSVVGRISATAPYAIFVHEGTKPHVIRPVSAKVLRFEGSGGVVFTRVVNHPGNAPNPWMRNALAYVIGS